ncbi:MAG: Gfo/Idh/MocA family oxidoreductase [Fimbriimonadaceae bacterium]|jgi:predicted dehydrogenase|nr:Gfo/Idh/MocA family oxidoreductase [Fimbriimonadaceae bacterium]
MAKPVLTIGLLGYQFMGKAHSNAYRQVGRYFDLPVEIRMKTICGRNEAKVRQAAEVFGWEGHETDWRKVIADPEIDIIDISTPGNTHCEMAIAAAEAGKILFCEKPIGNTLSEAEKMAEAVRKSGKPSAVFHNYRKAPAVALAKRMIDEGKIGKIFHFRACYLQDWIADPNFPIVWRLNKEVAGSGTHGDICSHIIDMGRYLVGEMKEVNGLLHTFVTERPIAGEIDDRMGASTTGEMGKVDVDDASIFLCHFESGALGTFEASRFAVGRKNYNRFELYGSKGSLIFNMERMNELEYYNNEDPVGTQGFRVIQATEGGHPYAGQYWPVGHIIGYEHTFMNLVADAVTAVHDGREPSPNMEEGLKNQRVLDAVERSSVGRCWVSL